MRSGLSAMVLGVLGIIVIVFVAQRSKVSSDLAGLPTTANIAAPRDAPLKGTAINNAAPAGIEDSNLPREVSTPTSGQTSSLESFEDDFERLLRSGREGPAYGIYAHVKSLHDKIVAEPRDSDWALNAERDWIRFYSGKPEVLSMGEPKIFCRSTMCEVRLLAKGHSTQFDSVDLEDLMTARGNAPRPCGAFRVVARDDTDEAMAVVAIIDLNYKSCGRDGVDRPIRSEDPARTP
jgi:hypothetical protein